MKSTIKSCAVKYPWKEKEITEITEIIELTGIYEGEDENFPLETDHNEVSNDDKKEISGKKDKNLPIQNDQSEIDNDHKKS